MNSKGSVLTAAAKRAAIIGILQKESAPVPIYKLHESPELEAFKFTKKTLENFVSTMKRANIIDSAEIDDPKAHVGYFLAGGKSVADDRQKRKYTKRLKQGTVPNLIVEYIEETQRARIEFPGGFFIEVGVVKKFS